MVRYSNIVHLKSGKCTRKEAYECQRQYRIDSKKCVSNRIFREEVEKKILDRIRQETGKGVTTGKKTQGNWIQDKQNYENEKKKMLYTLGDLQERQKNCMRPISLRQSVKKCSRKKMRYFIDSRQKRKNSWPLRKTS